MAAQTISATEEFVRAQFAHAIDEKRPIGPTARVILNTFLTETTSHVGQEEMQGAKATDANRFVVKLALGVLTERYSRDVVTPVLSLS